jgi:hypothetical protein
MQPVYMVIWADTIREPTARRPCWWNRSGAKLTCSKCPCPENCLARDIFCKWAAREPQNPVEMRAICDRSKGQQYPSIAVQARNLWVSVKEFVKSGGKLASKEERARRLAICESCEKWDKAQRRCTSCGCTSIKLWAASSRCRLPVPKWKEVTS